MFNKFCFEFIKREYKPILVFLLLFFINTILFKYKMCDVYIDFGKEIYLPKAIAEGGVLYKDVLAIFGPFSYLLNSVFIKILGVSIKTFYFIGTCNALLIIVGIYLLAREFFSRWISFFLSCFVLYFCCFVPDVMNFVTPYSYGMVYGLCSVIYSAVFFIKYLKSDENKFLYVSMFLSGTALANKYEFVLPMFVLVGFLFAKKVNWKVLAKAFVCGLTVPLLCLIVLWWQGLSVVDFLNYLSDWFKFANSSDMKNYYNGTFYFSFQYFLITLKSFIFSFIVLSVIYYGVKFIETLKIKFKHRYFAHIFYCIFSFVLLIFFCKYSAIFVNYIFYSVAMVLMILALLKVKNLCKNFCVLFLTLFALAVGLKSFFFMQINQYGRYFLPLILIAFIVVLKDYYFKDNNRIFKITLVYFLLLMSIAAFWNSLGYLKFNNYKITSQYGTIYKDEASAKVFSVILDSINKLTKKDDTVVVLQEGLMINFLSGRRADKYNYLIPALLELYGEENVVAQYVKTSPEMFIVFTSPDDKTLICNGWGYKICSFISKNYKLVQTIKAEKLILIFKKI